MSNSAEEEFTTGFLSIVQPAVSNIDKQVQTLRNTQMTLQDKIDKLNSDIMVIGDVQKELPNLEHYVKKLLNIKRRVGTVNNVLTNVQDRVMTLQSRVAKEQSRKRTLIDTSLAANQL